jgi:hypothetical protein
MIFAPPPERKSRGQVPVQEGSPENAEPSLPFAAAGIHDQLKFLQLLIFLGPGLRPDMLHGAAAVLELFLILGPGLRPGLLLGAAIVLDLLPFLRHGLGPALLHGTAAVSELSLASHLPPTAAPGECLCAEGECACRYQCVNSQFPVVHDLPP